MTKKDLTVAVANANPDLKRKLVEEAVHLFFDQLTSALSHHHRIELRGFGMFSIRKRGAHQAHNPQTGETLYIPEKVVPFFKPSHALRHALKEAYRPSPTRKKMKFFSTLYHEIMGSTKNFKS